ncbi:MAG: phosphatidate cytidylyltransferase [Clostridia bacterium]
MEQNNKIKNKGMNNMDLKRITSGFIVAISVAIMLLIPNKYVIGLLLAIIALVAMHEYLKAISKVCTPIKWVAYLSCLSVVAVNFIPEQNMLKAIMMFLPSIMLILFANVIATDMKISFKDMSYTLLGICYIPVFISFLTLIDAMQNGKILIGYILISAWGTDVFAYLIGKKFGKHKFSKVSPKKSIEGCIAGTIGAVLIMVLYTFILNRYFQFNYSYMYVIIVGIVLSLIGQIGDFSASCIKRYVDIKDYSNLLPGHGGMLDRIDSVLFLAPFAYLLFIL